MLIFHLFFFTFYLRKTCDFANNYYECEYANFFTYSEYYINVVCVCVYML